MNCDKCGADWGLVEAVQEGDGAYFECRSCGARRYGVIEGNILKLELGE